MSTPTTYISAPALVAAKGGLLAVATINDDQRGLTVEYQPEACGPAHVDIDRCEPPTNVTTIAVAADGSATLTIAEAPEDEVLTISWGDGTLDDTTSQTAVPLGPATETHTFTGSGRFDIEVTGTTFGTQTLHVWVVEGQATTGSSSNKVFDGVELIQGAPFTVYKAVSCAMLTDDTEARARRALELGEARAVEASVWNNLLAQGTTVDLTPGGGPVSVKAGIGMLEAYAGSMYGAVPTLHIPRAIVPSIPDLKGDDGTLSTLQGSKVANGAGYDLNTGPDGQEAAAGSTWLYVTGEVVLSRTPIKVHATQLLAMNEALAVAERVYAASAECFVAAIRVDLAG